MDYNILQLYIRKVVGDFHGKWNMHDEMPRKLVTKCYEICQKTKYAWRNAMKMGNEMSRKSVSHEKKSKSQIKTNQQNLI